VAVASLAERFAEKNRYLAEALLGHAWLQSTTYGPRR
jgi:hypothetical protein